MFLKINFSLLCLVGFHFLMPCGTVSECLPEVIVPSLYSLFSSLIYWFYFFTHLDSIPVPGVFSTIFFLIGHSVIPVTVNYKENRNKNSIELSCYLFIVG